MSANLDVAARAAPARAGANISGGGPAPRWTNALFVLPFLLVYATLLVHPVLRGLWMSLRDTDVFTGAGAFVGLDNYARLFTNDIFLGAVRNTFLFVLLTTPVFVVLGLALALALNRPGRTAAALRAVFFASSVLSVTVVTLVWKMVLTPDTGLFGSLAPLTNPLAAMPALAVVTVWWNIGLPMILFLAALQQIPGELYEAAALDNAGRWRTLVSVTLPSIRPTLLLVVVVEVVLQFQLFGQAYLMTQGGPNNATRPIVQFIYEAYFRDWSAGAAVAASQVLFVLMLAVAAVQIGLGRRRGAL